jgi:DNA polymerase III epsilon subunit-like protein
MLSPNTNIQVLRKLSPTGLPKHPAAKDSVQPRGIEFGGILIDEEFNELETLELLINPHQPLEDIIVKITGLTDNDLKDQPTFLEVAPAMEAIFAEADALVAHNAPFDRTILELELARNGITEWPWPKYDICTVQEHAELFGFRPSLVVLYQHLFGEPPNQVHRALDDVRILVDVFKKSGIMECYL